MKDKIKVIGLPSDEGACSYYRVEQPLYALEEAGLIDLYIPPITGESRFVRLSIDGSDLDDDPNLVNNHDLIVLQRQPIPSVNQLINGCNDLGIGTVFDIDDSAITIPPWNPNYMAWGKDKTQIRKLVMRYNRQGIDLPKLIRGMSPNEVAEKAQETRNGLLSNIRDSNVVTVTTEVLKEDYSRYNSNIHIIPNQMVQEHWEGLERIDHPGEIWIGWEGGWTHYEDLKVMSTSIRTVVSRYPNVKLVLVGFTQSRELVFDAVPDDRVILFEWDDDLSVYKKYVASMDIVLAPSVDIRFNRGKSDIRCMEAWLCGVPVVGSPSTYGRSIKESGGGFVANKPKDWISGLKKLITDEGLRRRMGQEGYEYVTTKRTYRTNTRLWYNVYRDLVDRLKEKNEKSSGTD